MHSDEMSENVSAIVFPNFISIHRGYWKSIRSVLQWYRPCWRYIINVLCALFISLQSTTRGQHPEGIFLD